MSYRPRPADGKERVLCALSGPTPRVFQLGSSVLEFSADTKPPAEALDQVQEAVERKSTVPILSHVLAQVSAKGPRLAVTDLEVGI